jgi:hypothetical protein
VKRLGVLTSAILLAASAFAGSSADDHAVKTSKRREPVVEKTVFITGSLIPQRIKVRPTGTATVSPVRIIDRVEIDQTGRFTTPGAFVNDPSVRIIGH